MRRAVCSESQRIRFELHAHVSGNKDDSNRDGRLPGPTPQLMSRAAATGGGPAASVADAAPAAGWSCRPADPHCGAYAEPRCRRVRPRTISTADSPSSAAPTARSFRYGSPQRHAPGLLRSSLRLNPFIGRGRTFSTRLERHARRPHAARDTVPALYRPFTLLPLSFCG